MERHTMRVFGIVALSLIFVGIAFGDDLMKLDKDGVVYYKVTPTGATSISATDNGAPALTVTQSGTSAAAIFSGGRVGIGTVSPLELFHVSGGHFLMDNQKAIKYKDSVGTAYPAFQLYNDEMYIDNQAAGGINFRTNSTKGSASIRMFIKNDGSVGIGTTSPTSDLEVIGIADSSAVLTVGAGSGASTDKVFRVLGDTNPVTERFTVLRGGNVGIGTANPPNKLSIRETTAGTNAVQIYNNASNAIKIRIPANGLSENFCGDESVLYVGKDVSTSRSINIAGSIGTYGNDYAEWVAWEGEKPEPGTIINYKGTNVIVSSQKTVGFIGGDNLPSGTAILIAFVGQVPVKVKGEVHEGDYIVPAGDGTGIAVSSKKIGFDEYRQAVGIAWQESEIKEVKTIKVAVGIK